MQYNPLGKTDLRVSRLCLGCMTFGEPDRGNHAWTLPEESSRPIIKRALEGGINFFDTANSYSDGSSEEIVGRALRDFARREDVVVATKVFHRVGDLPEGLSRAQILRSIDDSLRRLGMDYVDILQIHRWDYNTPIEETLEALNDVVKAGKARYIGASSMHSSQFAQALELQKQHGWAQFVSMQDHYNLIYREEEREMLPLCYQEGVAVIPWSPLARGRLTRPWGETTARLVSDEVGKNLYKESDENDAQIAERLTGVSEELGATRAQVALAWLLSKPGIKRALEGGINFFDTANSYSDGSSEEIVGRALRDFARREDVVVATKVFHRVGDLPEGLSRAQILRSIDDSLRRLGMDYVDILQIHRWDYNTPIEETLEALNDVVKAGKARYIGASSMHSSQFAQALELQKQHGWAQFVSMQDHYNLIYREEEREMLPLCYQEGVAVIPWSPLARGRLTRPWGETTARLVSDEVGKNLYKESDENDAQIAERLTGVSEELGATRAQVALAWLLSKPGIAAPIIGTSREEQLDELLNAVDITLKPEQIAELETPYKPHPVVGFK